MTREEVIRGLECCMIPGNGGCDDCPYIGKGVCQELLGEDALALLKAQEPIEARLNLCESCAKEYPECDATIDGMEFGCGVGNDNIIGCTAYVNRWKIQEPVEPIENAGFYYCGACKYAFTSARQKYCSDCGRAVKWE